MFSFIFHMETKPISLLSHNREILWKFFTFCIFIHVLVCVNIPSYIHAYIHISFLATLAISDGKSSSALKWLIVSDEYCLDNNNMKMKIIIKRKKNKAKREKCNFHFVSQTATITMAEYVLLLMTRLNWISRFIYADLLALWYFMLYQI